jgi:WD repeat-containing protein 48
MEAVAPWASIDTRTGRLAVVLEEYNCFDAEMYADDLELEEPIEFRDDQRSMYSLRVLCIDLADQLVVNLGKWILRHIFSKLIDEMIKRDEALLKDINATVAQNKALKASTPMSIQMPPSPMTSWENGSGAVTPRGNGLNYPMTPGMGIGVATPGAVNVLPGVPEDGTTLDKRASRTSADKPGDYFSNASIAAIPDPNKPAPAPTEPVTEEKPPKSPNDTDKATNGKESGLFGKKFKMNMSFKKNLGRSASTATEKPVVVEDKVEEDSETSEPAEKEVDDSFNGILQKIKMEYDKQLLENPEELIESGITPSLPNETPVLKPPPLTTVIIQEETSGGSADLYRGTVDTVGTDASMIEQRAPMWLGDLLLRVCLPCFIARDYADIISRIAYQSRSQ